MSTRDRGFKRGGHAPMPEAAEAQMRERELAHAHVPRGMTRCPHCQRLFDVFGFKQHRCKLNTGARSS
jgi:hypothetical protein